MKLRCDRCLEEIEVPSVVREGVTFSCPRCDGTRLRVRQNPLRLEVVPDADSKPEP